MIMFNHVLFSVLVLGFACFASCTKQTNSGSPDFDLLLDEETNLAKTPLPRARHKNLVISRHALKETVESGFGTFLSQVHVDPHFVQQRFDGWKITKTPYDSFDLVPGDVVKSINGSTAEKPNQAFELWQSLNHAESISFSVERDGQLMELTLAVSDTPAPLHDDTQL